MTDIEKIELAIRRVSDRLKREVPWDMGVTSALDAIADELCSPSDAGRSALSKVKVDSEKTAQSGNRK